MNELPKFPKQRQFFAPKYMQDNNIPLRINTCDFDINVCLILYSKGKTTYCRTIDGAGKISSKEEFSLSKKKKKVYLLRMKPSFKKSALVKNMKLILEHPFSNPST